MSLPTSEPHPPHDDQWWQTTGQTAFGCPGCSRRHGVAPVVRHGAAGWLVAWNCPACGTSTVQIIDEPLVDQWGAVLAPWRPYQVRRGTGRLLA